MKAIAFVCVLIILISSETEGIKNWLQHELYPCVQCLCHARSGCWIRQNCARYSINYDYWKTAGSLVASPNDLPYGEESYKNCMKDENCIVGTIIQYTQKFGQRDCNCDGEFDCKDRLAIHLFGPNCENPKFGQVYASRFNHCSQKLGVKSMLKEEGVGCELTPVEVY